MTVKEKFRPARWVAAAVLVAAIGIVSVFALMRDDDPPPATKVTLQLPWRHSGAFAGYYLADQNGYYAEQGLEIGFREGGGPVDPIESVVAGEAQIGIASGNHLLQARAEGKPVRVVAVIHQLNPVLFAALEESGIRHPRQFAGKTIRSSRTNLPILQALAKKFGVGRDAYTVIDIESTEEVYQRFYRGEIDVMTGFQFWTRNKFDQDGKKAVYMYPDDYGIHFYRDSLFTTDDFIARNPELVEGFLRATFRGWANAADDPGRAGPLTLIYRPEADTTHATAFLTAMLPLINTGETPIGSMSPEIWNQMGRTLSDLDLLPDTFDPREVYSMRFLQTIYPPE